MACSMMISICRRASIPRLLPIGEPSGITVAVPIAMSAYRTGSLDAYLPVPTSRRDVNSRSAIFNFEGLSAIAKKINEFVQTRECRSGEHRAASLSFLAACRKAFGAFVAGEFSRDVEVVGKLPTTTGWQPCAPQKTDACDLVLVRHA